MVHLPIANVFAMHRYEFPVTSLQRPTATCFLTGIDFLNDVSFLLILGASSATSSRNDSPDIRKSFFQFPLRKSSRRSLNYVASLFCSHIPCTFPCKSKGKRAAALYLLATKNIWRCLKWFS